jgi:predicted flap endonuclease-1-like 5' DNA nuclease
MFWAFVWWAIALVAALLVFFLLSRLIAGDPAAGLVFGGVTFVVVGLLLVAFGPGPAASRAATPAHAHHAPAAAVAPAPAPAVHAPVAEPAPPAAEPVEGPIPGSGISERVREAARAAGEAARALADPAPAAVAAAGPIGSRQPTRAPAPREGGSDDLKKIKGVGPKIEDLLHTLGIYHFDQIADWGAPEIAWMDSNLEGFNGRVTRDDWVGQAKLLAAGGETEFSRRVDRGEVY